MSLFHCKANGSENCKLCQPFSHVVLFVPCHAWFGRGGARLFSCLCLCPFDRAPLSPATRRGIGYVVPPVVTLCKPDSIQRYSRGNPWNTVRFSYYSRRIMALRIDAPCMIAMQSLCLATKLVNSPLTPNLICVKWHSRSPLRYLGFFPSLRFISVRLPDLPEAVSDPTYLSRMAATLPRLQQLRALISIDCDRNVWDQPAEGGTGIEFVVEA